MKHSGELRVSEQLYQSRRDRLEELLKLNAPRSVLCAEAELFVKCFRWSWKNWWHDWRHSHFPDWLWYITDKGYRTIYHSLSKGRNSPLDKGKDS